MIDDNASLRAVEALLRHDRVAEATRAIDLLPRGYAEVAYLDAIIAWRESRPRVARARFDDAIEMAAHATWMADRAQFEVSQGCPDAACTWYARAIAAEPAASAPWRLRLGLALLQAERLMEARDTLEQLVADVPQSALAWQALGACLRECEDHAGSMAAFERVLSLKPNDPLALLSRAQILSDLGRPAIAGFVAALAADPRGSQPRRALAAATAAEGDSRAGCALLRDRLTSEPNWVEGWQTLASLTHRWEGRPAFIEVVEQGLCAVGAQSAPLLLSMLALAGEHVRVLEQIDRLRADGDTAPMLALRAVSLDESGQHAAAGEAFAQLAPLGDPAIDIARIRHALRMGDPGRAQSVAAPMAEGDPRSPAWPYLATAWRMLGDPRWEWLEGDPRLVGEYDLGLSTGDLTALAGRLRTLHHTGEAPFEQSLRHGTQTEGHLLSREDREIVALRDRLREAIAHHIRQLPPEDSTHPTLRHRPAHTRFSGSWSVRLTGGGFHVNHVHSEGWLSSACYVALPDGVGGMEGCLALGQPPSELGLALPPSRIVTPRPGKLALFPSTMWHGTTPFAAGERLTVAFDVKPLA